MADEVRTVLLVEDEDDMVMLTRAHFTKRGNWRTVALDRAVDAVAWLARNEAQLILLDTNLADGRSDHALPALRRLSGDALVIAFTASFDVDSREYDGVLEKPFSSDQVTALIERAEKATEGEPDPRERDNGVTAVTTQVQRRMPDRALRLAEDVEDLAVAVLSGTEAAATDGMIREAHGLAGTAGIVGFSAMSSTARELELRLREPLDMGAAAGLTELCDRLRESARIKPRPITTNVNDDAAAADVAGISVVIVEDDRFLNDLLADLAVAGLDRLDLHLGSGGRGRPHLG